MEEKNTEAPDNLEQINSDVSTFGTGALVVFFGKLFRSLIQFIFLILVSRMLGADSFGIYMLGFTIISFTEIVARLGLDNAAIRFVSVHNGLGEGQIVKSVISRALLYTLAFSLLISLLLFSSAELLAVQFFGKPGLVYVIQMLSVSIPFLAVMSIALAATQGFKRMDFTAYSRDIFFPLVNFSLVILFYFIGSRLTGVLSAWILASISTLVLSLYYLRKLTSGIKADKPEADRAPPKLPGLLGYASPLLLVVLLTTLMTWVDILMLGYFRSSAEVGLYGAATRTAVLTSLILVSINTIFSPIIADLHNRKQTQRLESMFKFSANWIYIFSLPVFLVFLLFARDIMSVFGAEFLHAWHILVIVSFTYFVNASTGSVGFMLIMSGHQKLMLYNSVAIFLFNLVGNYLLVPRYGMTGAAITSCLSIASYNFIMLIQVYLRLGMHPYSMRFVRVSVYGLVCFSVFFLLVNAMEGPSLLRLLLIAPLFMGAYFYMIYKNCIGDEEMVIVDAIKAKFRPAVRSSGS